MAGKKGMRWDKKKRSRLQRYDTRIDPETLIYIEKKSRELEISKSQVGAELLKRAVKMKLF